ncbi:hypothetical protein BH24ACT15_BH24ACT15_37140 [soil metagenome]
MDWRVCLTLRSLSSKPWTWNGATKFLELKIDERGNPDGA